MVTSLAPMYGRVSPEASVDTISLGRPTGRSRIAAAATDALPEAPIAAIPCRRPSACRRPAITPAPRPITSIACPRSAARTSWACSAPPARATSSRDTSAATCGEPITPASTRTTPAPASPMRSRRNAYSWPLVSSVPTRTIVGLGMFHAEPAALGLGIARQLGRRRLGEDAPGHHHELPVGQRRRHREVLLDHEHGQPLLRQAAERLDEHLDDRRRQALGGLVHDQELRVAQQ